MMEDVDEGKRRVIDGSRSLKSSKLEAPAMFKKGKSEISDRLAH